MKILSSLIVLFVGVIAAQADDGYQPMVAFLCNRPAMYRTEQGWVKDDNTGCLMDPADIINYCKKVFPNLDIRNVVEANEKQSIANWCDFGRKSCSHQFTVRPFRCLVGPFQSDALLVPEHCVFDHIHDFKMCTSYDEWNKTATRSCLNRGQVQQSFAILQPCGLDKFSGVEFVCCPPEEDENIVKKIASSSSSSLQNQNDNNNKQESYDESLSEHEYFLKAKEELQRHHQDKVTKMMKEWSEARQRIQEMESTNPRRAEKMNKEITNRFQKEYSALEQEGILEKKQLISLHQNRVQSDLNRKKSEALDQYMAKITSASPESGEILRVLKQYIKVVQKDRLHTVSRYRHLLDVDPEQAEKERPRMVEHLKSIEKELNLALDELERLDDYQQKMKIKTQIAEYLRAYKSIDDSIETLIYRQSEHNGHIRRRPTVPKDPNAVNNFNTNNRNNKQQQQLIGGKEDISMEDNDDDEDSYDDDDEDDDDDDDDEDSYDEEDDDEDEYDDDEDVEDESIDDDDSSQKGQGQVVEPSTRKSEALYRGIDDIFDAKSDQFVRVKPAEHVAHMAKSNLDINQQYIAKAPVKSVNGIHAAVPLGIAVAVITVIVVIIGGVVVMRRRNRHFRSNLRKSDGHSSPEEVHVTRMQVNGYENPTYKYFENGN